LAFAYALLFLLPIAAIAYIVWDHSRKAAERNAASAGRLEEILAVAAKTPAEAAIAPEPAPLADPTQLASADRPANMPASYVVRERLLTPPQTLLYYLLKTGLPDHNVFALTPVASLIEPGPSLAAYAREEQARIFARHVVDFAVADKSTRPVAVVKLIVPGDAPQGDLSLVRTWFAAVGVRYVELDPSALPRKEALRAIVLDGADASQKSESDAARPS
jgi:hypothetical protein